MGGKNLTAFGYFLEKNNIKYVFGNPGTTETSLLAIIGKTKDTEYILGLQESTVIGMAAGYAAITKKPAIVNIHTYCGLANSLCNLYSAKLANLPLMVIAGQQHQDFLIQEPILSGPLVELAKTAVKYGVEVSRGEDLSLLLDRCYFQAQLAPSGPTFLSIPMNLAQAPLPPADHYYPPHATVIDQTAQPKDVDQLIKLCQTHQKIAFIADTEVNWYGATAVMHQVAAHFNADVYEAPVSALPTIDVNAKNCKGTLPKFTDEIKATLNQYDLIILWGSRLLLFYYRNQFPFHQNMTFVQVSLDTTNLGFAYSANVLINANVKACLTQMAKQLNLKPTKLLPSPKANHAQVYQDLIKSHDQHSYKGLAIEILNYLDRDTALTFEASAEVFYLNNIAVQLGFENRYSMPRTGGLGWAMPFATGISLAANKPTVCFVGDGGSLFAMHAIWSAAKYRLPVIFICHVNREYKILKDLWDLSNEQGKYVGLEYTNPTPHFAQIGEGFCARTAKIKSKADIKSILHQALTYKGPTFITIDNKDLV